jgi:hypothetical protein
VQAAPPVSVDGPTVGRWRWVQAALHALAAAALLAWGGRHLGLGGMARGASVLGGAIGAKVGWIVCAANVARLRGTGRQWLLRLPRSDDTPAAAPGVRVDLGGWMLLRVDAAGMRARKLTVSRHAAGADWPAFRAAVYSNASGLGSRSLSERPPF